MAHPKATLDNCGNCRYFNRRHGALTDEERREGFGVCEVMSSPDDYDNDLAYAEDYEAEDDDTSILIVRPEFFCALYKVGS